MFFRHLYLQGAEYFQGTRVEGGRNSWCLLGQTNSGTAVPSRVKPVLAD